MKNDEKFIWSMLLHLGHRMWGDDDSLKPMPDTLAFDYDVWKEATERMARRGAAHGLHAIDLVGQSMLN